MFPIPACIKRFKCFLLLFQQMMHVGGSVQQWVWTGWSFDSRCRTQHTVWSSTVQRSRSIMNEHLVLFNFVSPFFLFQQQHLFFSFTVNPVFFQQQPVVFFHRCFSRMCTTRIARSKCRWVGYTCTDQDMRGFVGIQ